MRRARFGPWRRAAQAAVALLYLALPLLSDPRLTGTLVALRVGPVDLVEPAAALGALLAAGGAPLALALGVLPPVALGVALGPVYCGWLCPWGALAEGIDRLRARGARRPAGPTAARPRARLAWLLGLLGAGALAGVPLAAVVSPPRLATALPLEALSSRALPFATGALLLVFLAVEVLGPRRVVCRVLCPAGAAVALLRTRATFGPRFEAEACRCAGSAASPCRDACPLGLDPRALGRLDGCTSCMACVDRCPSTALVALRRR
ncbi:MAG: 4Fe-4S binding protein [Anaeromyxobacteraceae bacterium]